MRWIHIFIIIVALLSLQPATTQPAIDPTPVVPSVSPQAQQQVFDRNPVDPEVAEFEKELDPLQDNLMENEERKEEMEENRRKDLLLRPWIAQEIEAAKENGDMVSHQQFAFRVDKEYEFKWNPSKKGSFRILIEVFNYENGHVNYPSKPDEDDNIQLLSKSDISYNLIELGKVYLRRVFTLNFHSDFQIIKIVNNYDSPMLVQVSLELTNFVPEKGLDDDQFKLSAEKIKGILNELEDTEVHREKMYKTEWSFRDREEQHQSEMLSLTGVELLVILGTAVVQMYCIKSLLDNRLIV